MKRLLQSLVINLLVVASTAALAEPTPAPLSTDPQQIETLIQASGCRYEVSAAAQTIAQLQKQINDLQKQLGQAKGDPPKKK